MFDPLGVQEERWSDELNSFARDRREKKKAWMAWIVPARSL
jgi:hypothetical protein